MSEHIPHAERWTHLPPPPIDARLPVPEPEFLKRARANLRVFQGQRMVCRLNRSYSYPYAFWGIFALLMSSFYAVILLSGGGGVAPWFVLSGFAITAVLLARSVYLWYRGDTFHFVLNREGCTPGTAIASLFLRGELLYHEEVSWRDIHIIEMTNYTKSGRNVGYVLRKPYAFPPCAIPDETVPSDEPPGLILAGGGSQFKATSYLLDSLQYAAGRPDGLDLRETVLAALQPEATYYTPEWFATAYYRYQKEKRWSAQTALSYKQSRSLHEDGHVLPRPENPYANHVFRADPDDGD